MKPVVAIFAHPDDEAFGSAGTLALLAKEREVYLICVTDGSAGMNSSEKTRALAEIREEELLNSAKVLGVKEVFFLGYKDGSLANNLYHEVAEKIQKILEGIQPDTIITDELRGVSGHLDHIAVSFITTFVFNRLNFIHELWYYCVTETRRAMVKDYFIYFPPGYKKEEISKVVDVSVVWQQKIEAMYQHESQRHDVERILKEVQDLPQEENFILLTK